MPVGADEKFALARKLAHNEKSVRDEAMSLVKQWLDRRKELSDQDYFKLWKALYYCMWMSDKPLVQHELAQNLADIVLALSPDRAAPFLNAFFQTMVREWAGTDHLRLDKFLALVRKMITSFFKYMLSSDYIEDASVCDSLIDVLKSTVFAKDKKDSRGIAMHVADVFVDELEVALEKVEQTHDEDAVRVLESLLRFIISIVTTKGLDKILFKRVKESVLDRIVTDVEAVAMASEDADVQVSNLITLVLMNAARFATVAFDAASDPDSAERSRAPLYELRKRFIALQAQVDDALMDSDDDASTSSDPETPSPADNDHNDLASDSEGAGRVADIPSNVGQSELEEAPEPTETVIDSKCGEASPVPDDAAPVPTATDDAGSQATEAATTEPTAERNEETGSRRRHRRRKQSQIVSVSSSDPVAPPVKRPKSDDAGGSAAPRTEQSGDAIVGDVPVTPKSKSVHFSATKSVRRFNKKVPMKVAQPTKELISKRPTNSVLKTRQ